MKILIYFTRGLLTLVWAVLLGVNILLYVEETAQGHCPPQLGDWAFWTVEDPAMEPAYAQGDLLLVKMGVAGAPGDVVLARAQETLLLRRVIGTTEGQFILKSDGAQDSALAPPQAVEGVCRAYLPGCGPAAAFLRSLPGLIAIFVAGLVLIVLPALGPRRAPAGIPLP